MLRNYSTLIGKLLKLKKKNLSKKIFKFDPHEISILLIDPCCKNRLFSEMSFHMIIKMLCYEAKKKKKEINITKRD